MSVMYSMKHGVCSCMYRSFEGSQTRHCYRSQVGCSYCCSGCNCGWVKCCGNNWNLSTSRTFVGVNVIGLISGPVITLGGRLGSTEDGGQDVCLAIACYVD